MKTKKLTSYAEEETKKIANDIAKQLRTNDTVFLTGDLGSGKTTFVKGMAEAYGISTRILSPTFSLLRIHKVEKKEAVKKGIKFLYHIDAYRIEDGDKEIEETLKELKDRNDGIICIEWADNLKNLKIDKKWQIQIKYTAEDIRQIAINGL